MGESAAEKRRGAILAASAGGGFPTLGIQVKDGVVLQGGLAGGGWRRGQPIGQIKGASLEILPGKHVDEGRVRAQQLLTGSTPMSKPIVFITFADGTYHEHYLSFAGSFTVEGSLRKAKDEARRFNLLAASSS
jgi:hypothetical protein